MISLEQGMYDQTLSSVQQLVDKAVFQEECEAGEKLTIDKAFELAMR